MLAACGAQPDSARTLGQRLSPLYGTQRDAASVTFTWQSVVVTFGTGSPSVFEQLDLPEGMSATNLVWSGVNAAGGHPGALAIALANPAGLELGVCRLPGQLAQPVSLSMDLIPALRSGSMAPAGPENNIADMTVVDIGAGQVAMAWTQINNGDLDLNGEVNAADLATIAKNFNATYDVNDPHKTELPAYWADGDGNGVINAADVSIIGKHYHADVSGYNIRRNGQLIPGAHVGEPTVLAGLGNPPQPGLPKRYSIIMLGSSTDSWQVSPVDAAGAAGINSAGHGATTDILANLTVGGLPLLDLNGANPGGFGNTKFSSRVIDPIETTYGLSVANPLAVAGTTSIYTGVPRNRVLFLLFSYLPNVNLSTGAPKGPSTEHAASAADDLVTTAVPFQLPPNAATAQIGADISLVQAPGGGYYVELVSSITVPGQPATTTHTRLDYATGQLVRDANNDGEYDDDSAYLDTDRDCVSDALLASAQNSDQYAAEDRVEGKLVGVVSSVDADHGTITFASRTLVGGDLTLPDAPLTLSFNEQTFFDGQLSPDTLAHGTEVQVEFYRLHDPQGAQGDAYWIKGVYPSGAHNTGFISASDNEAGQITLHWNNVDGFPSVKVVRYAPDDAGVFQQDWDHIFDGGANQYVDTNVTPGVTYRYVYLGIDGQTTLQLGSDTGTAQPAS
jgi:hypothetical protein